MPVTIRDSLLLVLLWQVAAYGQVTQTSGAPSQTLNQQSRIQSLVDSLNRAQELIKTGKVPDALALLDETREKALVVETENLTLKEEVLWQTATANLDFSQLLTNPEQFKRYASDARDRWLDYINWFDGLSDKDRAKLPPSHIRINMATRFLGNASVRMGDRRRLLDDYKNIPRVEYLGLEAIELWKDTLYQCPDWLPVTDRTARLRREKVCAEDCQAEWVAYAATLSEWATKYKLRKAARDSYFLEAKQIQEAAERCGSKE